MANIIEILIKAKDETKGAFSSTLNGLSSVGSSLQNMGKQAAIATAPIALALGVAVNSAMAFDTAMTNTGAVMGKTRGEMQGLSREVLAMGKNSLAGPQATAEAFYDIAGGVSNASARMAILEASMATSEAGAADLGDTTRGLIAVMNSYQFAAEDAAHVSDVLTRTVGMGVGTMGDFASALPSITGLANSLEISFDDLASATAYLTTQGNTASQATTQLSAMMTAMLNPNEAMKQSLTDLGFASGSAAIEQLGLVGAMNALNEANTAEEMAKMLGSTEALRGVTALAGPEFKTFADEFAGGIQGATAAAQAIQLEAPAAQFELLKSKLSGLGIEAGQVLLPIINDLLTNTIMPMVDGIMKWAQENPETVKAIVLLGGAAVVAGPILGAMGLAVSGLGTALGLILSPAGLLIGLIVGIVAAADKLYPGGIGALLRDASKAAEQLAYIGLAALNEAAKTAEKLVRGLVSAFQDAIGKAREFQGAVAESVGTGKQAQGARQTVTEGLASGQITTNDVWSSAYGSVKQQFGGGVGGDIAASLIAPQFVHGTMNGSYTSASGSLNPALKSAFGGQRAEGGPVMGGVSGRDYLVGEEGPEILSMRPGTSGRVVPNDQLGGGGGIQFNGPMNFYGNTREEGAAMAQGFTERLPELIRQNGLATA